VQIRRPDRVLAALLLAALGACLALLAQPSAASSLDSYDIRASIRYGCGQDDGDDNFVEVTLSAEDWDGDDSELLLQVGLAGPDSPGSANVFPEGGPSLVTLGENPTKVRLAGPVHDGDHVFLRQVDRSEVINLPLQASCHRIKPTDFGLSEPAVRVAEKSCTAGSQANLEVTLDNPNDVDRQLQKIGIDEIDYTVLLVRHDGQLAGTDPVGTLMSFDEPSSSAITVSQVVAKPARYEVRVIALDGSVVTSDSLRLSCSGKPGPSSSSQPSPSVPVTSQPRSSPAPSTPATTTHPPTSPAPSSPAASSAAPSSSAPVSSAPASSAVTSSAVTSSAVTSSPSAVSSRPATSSPAGSAGGPTDGSSPSRPNDPAPRSGNSGVQPPNATVSGPAGAGGASSSSSPSPEPSIIRLVEPRANYGGLPVFQKDVAVVVLVFSGALTALVGSTVINARRR
jgi:hypothetical protein